MFTPALAAAIALFAQAPSTAPATPAAPAKTAPATDSSAVVCRSEEDTGTRFGHRVCHTRAEWQAISAAASESVSKMQQQGGMTGGPH